MVSSLCSNLCLKSPKQCSHHNSCYPSSSSVSEAAGKLTSTSSVVPPTTGPSHVTGCLKHSRCGLHPTLVGSMRSPASTSGRSSSHDAVGERVVSLRSPSFTTRLYRSTSPLARGCTMLITRYSTPRPCRYVLNYPMYSRPWSVRTTLGTPYLQVTPR